jgi:hypothetical protein
MLQHQQHPMLLFSVTLVVFKDPAAQVVGVGEVDTVVQLEVV